MDISYIIKTNIKKRKQDFFIYIPSEILIEILSRVPAETILSCKCVCKSWHDLVSTLEFVKFYLSKSIPGLAITVEVGVIDKIIEVTNVLDIHHYNLHSFYLSTITKLKFTHSASIVGSVDGLLLLQKFKGEHQLHLCNPITRECIDLLHSQSQQFDPSKVGIIMYGFGVSKISGQYKAVGIFHDQSNITSQLLPEPECKVYTIGTGSWRSIEPDALVRYNINNSGAFVNGNLHWLAHDLNDTLRISCFDLETQLFTTFSPPLLCNKKTIMDVLLFVVEGTLSLSDYITNANAVTIWLMKENGVEKYWTKEFVIRYSPDRSSILFFPIRFSEDGVIFLAHNSDSLFYYSNKDKTTQKICNSKGCVYMTSHSHTPSFLSLKRFQMENSIPF